MPARFEGVAAQVFAELTADVRAAIDAELRRYEERALVAVPPIGPSCPVNHLHAEGYCLRVRSRGDGALAVFELSVRCAKVEESAPVRAELVGA